MATATETVWHLCVDGKVMGPYTSQALAARGQAGRVRSGMLASKNGGPWAPVERVKGLTVTPVMATRRQVEYARDLGLVVSPDATAAQVSEAIDAVRGRCHATGQFVRKARPQHVTIEKTGKGIKFAMLCNWLVFFLGVAVWIVGAAATAEGHTPKGEISPMLMLGSCTVLGTFVFGAYLRAARWWHHG